MKIIDEIKWLTKSLENISKIVVFSYELPFYLPVSDNDWYSFESEYYITSLRFSHKVRKKMKLPYNITEVTIFQSMKGGWREDPSSYFDDSLKDLNNILLAVALAEQEDGVFEIVREQLSPIIPMHLYILDKTNWKRKTTLLLMINENVPVQESHTTNPEEMLRIASVIRKSSNPFVIYMKFRMFASRHLRHGEYSESVIYSQLSVEIFLRRLWALADPNMKPEKYRQEDFSDNFMGLLKQIGHVTGGSWDLKLVGSVAHKYIDKCYKLRGRVIHSGYNPSPEEAAAAIEASGSLISYAKGLIKRNKKLTNIKEMLFVS